MADVYYLDGNKGRDTYNGSTSQPFKTWKTALAAMSAGDTLIVRSATYPISTNKTGSAETIVVSKNNVKILAETKNGPVIDGEWTGTYNNADSPDGYTPVLAVTGDNVTVDGVKVVNGKGRGISVYNCKFPVIRNCYVKTTYGAGFRIESSDVTIEKNECEDASRRRLFHNQGLVEDWPVSFLLIRTARGTVSENVVHDCGGEGISSGRGCSNITFYRNICYDNAPLQFYLVWSQNCTFDSNIAYISTGFSNPFNGNNIGFALRDEAQFGDSYSRSSGNKFINNLIVGCPVGFQIANKYNMQGDLVANNTFSNCTVGLQVFSAKEGWIRSDSRIEGNIFRSPSSIVSTSGITFARNCWYPTPNSGKGTGDVYANPLLSDATVSVTAGAIDKTDYYLTSSSPARNKAPALESVAYDFNGAPRDNTPDMGAFEYRDSTGGSIAASFTGTPTSGSKPLDVQFTNASTSDNGIDSYSYEWRVSGGTWAEFSTGQNPSLTFASEGTYDVRLTVSGTDGTDTQTRTEYVTVTDSTVVTDELVTDGTFDATFSTNWTSAPSGLTVNTGSNVLALSTISGLSNPQFFQTVSVDAGKSYTLTFDAYSGSSSISGVRIRLRKNTSPYTIYGLEDTATLTTSSTSYTYTFTCDTTDSAARLQFLVPDTTQTLYFDNISLKETTLVGEQIDVNFQADATTGESSVDVTFEDLSQASTEIISWSWEYSSDGEATWTEFSTAQAPTNTFTAGTYSIRLTVSTSDSSASITKSDYIGVTTGASAGQSGTDLITTVTPTSTGYQEITLDLDEEAVGFLFVVSGATADDTAADEALFCIGFSDGVNEAAVAVIAEHGQGTTDTNNRGVTDKCCLIIDDSGGVVGEANFVSASATSLTIDWTTAPSSAYKMMVLAFTHDDAQVFNFTMHGTTNSATSVSLPWDASSNETLLILASTDDDIGDTVNVSARLCIGFANGSEQASVFSESLSGGAASSTIYNVSSTKALTFTNTTPAVDYEGEVSLTASGFDCTTRTGTPSGVDVCGIAVKLASGNSSYITTAATPTSTGDQSYSGWGIEPSVLFSVGSLATADDTPANSAGITQSFGVATSDAEYSISWTDEDAAATSNTQSLAATAALSVPDNDGSTGIDATLSSFDSTGVTLNYGAVLGTARRVVLAGIEQDQFTIPTAEMFIIVEDDPTVVLGDVTVSPDTATATVTATSPTVNASDLFVLVDGPTVTITATGPTVTMPGSTVLKPRTRAHTLTARRKEVGSVFGVREEPLWISTVESRYYTINPTTISDYGTPSAIVSTSLYDVTDPSAVTDVTSTGISGSSSVSGGSIITAFVDGTALTDGNEYELEIVFTNTRGETVLVTSEIIASRRG